MSRFRRVKTIKNENKIYLWISTNLICSFNIFYNHASLWYRWWDDSSLVWLHQELGVVLMSSTELTLKYCLWLPNSWSPLGMLKLLRSVSGKKDVSQNLYFEGCIFFFTKGFMFMVNKEWPHLLCEYERVPWTRCMWKGFYLFIYYFVKNIFTSRGGIQIRRHFVILNFKWQIG